MPGCYHKLSESDEQAVLYSFQQWLPCWLPVKLQTSLQGDFSFAVPLVKSKRREINYRVGPFL